ANSLSRAKMNEQEGVVRVTIQPQGSSGTLMQELKDGRSFSFPIERVSNMERVQLRGVSATAEPLSGDAWMDLEVLCPKQVLKSGGIVLPEVPMRLGRVSSSASLNVRDAVGGRAIMNRSPIGDWQAKATADDRGDQVTHLHLDFHIAFSLR